MKEISSMDFPQHGEVFYFYGHALQKFVIMPSVFGFSRCADFFQYFSEVVGALHK
jgi:hypothetical protein